VAVEARDHAAVADVAVERALVVGAQRARAQRLDGVVRELEQDVAPGVDAHRAHEERRALERDVGPVDVVLEAPAAVVGARDPAVERAREVLVGERLALVEPAALGVAHDAGLAGQARRRQARFHGLLPSTNLPPPAQPQPG
jgi:hypothetical protein